jgi:hypothetical protein
MAIDFMIMPLSRYVSGDFVTPVMEFAWATGVPYKLVGPEGVRELPPNTPFGGPDAPERRLQYVDLVLDDLRGLSPEVAGNLWDERSPESPRFHRVDPVSYQELLKYFEEPRRSSALRFWQPTRPSHSMATIFLPIEFDAPLGMTSPFERTAGSTPRALRELDGMRASRSAESAAETLKCALRDSAEIRLPMIVDW